MDSEAINGDDVGMPPEIAVDLATELLEETNILPTSHDHKSSTDVPPPPTVAVVEVDVATQEILKL